MPRILRGRRSGVRALRSALARRLSRGKGSRSRSRYGSLGVALVEASLYHESYGASRTVELSQVQGDTWAGTWTVPNLYRPESGTWATSRLRMPHPWPITVRFPPTGRPSPSPIRCSPILRADDRDPSIALSAGPTAEPGERVTVTVKVTDPSGVALVEASLYHESHGASRTVELSQVQGDTWAGTWTVPNLVLPGKWHVGDVSAEDASPMANYSSISSDGPSFTITNPLQSDFAGPTIGSPSIALSAGPTASRGKGSRSRQGNGSFRGRLGRGLALPRKLWRELDR